MNLLEKLKDRLAGKEKPEHLPPRRAGRASGEKTSTAGRIEISHGQFSFKRGEIDLVFRDGDCLAFVEVKNAVIRGLDASGGGGQRAQAAVAFANRAGLSAAAEKSGGEDPIRHRRGAPGRRQSTMKSAFAEHVCDGQAIPLRVKLL